MSAHAERLEPVGGPLWTRPFKLALALFLAGMVLVAIRFVVGIGPLTALTDGYPWGTWKPFNVIVLTALGSGGYAMALLVYVLNRGRYHALARTAILTSALGYTTGILALGIDIGRPWNFVRLAAVWNWNLHSVLLEVAVCVSTYVIFLWLEAAPPFLEAWARRPAGALRTFATRTAPLIDRLFPWIIAMAIVLPTMHQSSLGSLFLLAGPRLHPLWQTPMVPLLFLLSCYVLGYACVVLVSLASSLAWRRPADLPMIRALSTVMAGVMGIFILVRIADVLARGVLPLALAGDRYSAMFWLEIVLFAIPAAGYLATRATAGAPLLFRLAMVTALAGSLYRIDSSLVAFMPGSHWKYFPSVTELIITCAFPALAFLGYLFIVKRFAILPAAVPEAALAGSPLAIEKAQLS